MSSTTLVVLVYLFLGSDVTAQIAKISKILNFLGTPPNILETTRVRKLKLKSQLYGKVLALSTNIFFR